MKQVELVHLDLLGPEDPEDLLEDLVQLENLDLLDKLEDLDLEVFLDLQEKLEQEV